MLYTQCNNKCKIRWTNYLKCVGIFQKLDSKSEIVLFTNNEKVDNLKEHNVKTYLKTTVITGTYYVGNI